LLLFKGIAGKKIEADFNGGEIRSDAKPLFLREVENQKGKTSLYEEKSSQLCRKHNSQDSLKIKSTHVSTFLAVLESIFFLFSNL